jgi:HlyD family secretion protein
MDRVIEKTKTQKLMKYWPHLAGGIALLVVVGWVGGRRMHLLLSV